MLGPPRKSLSSGTNRSSTRVSPCYRVSRQRWPLYVAVIGVISAAVALRLGVGLNVSRSAPRGIYRTAAEAPTRGALVIACLPAGVAALGRARGYLGPGDCPARTQPVLKRVGAVAADVVELGAEAVTVNGVVLLTQPIDVLDSTGRPLPHVAFGSFVVADSEVWLFGPSRARSWDSRYFGPVPMASVRSAVRPVVTIG